MKTRILVLGANGKTGRKVIQHLQQKEVEYRIGSRKANPAFDWGNPNSWEDALEDISHVYITFQPDLAVPGAKDIITSFTSLAVKKGVNKLVLLSGRGENEAQECEQIVIKAGVAWTIVRAGWFNQNFSESFLLDPIKAGVVALPNTEAKEPFVDTGDIAEVATASLLDEKHNGQVYELTGPKLLSFKDAISEISKATGREIKLIPVSVEEYCNILKDHNVPEGYIWLLNYLFTQVFGQNSHTANGVEQALGRPAKDFTQYVKEIAATGVWNEL